MRRRSTTALCLLAAACSGPPPSAVVVELTPAVEGVPLPTSAVVELAPLGRRMPWAAPAPDGAWPADRAPPEALARYPAVFTGIPAGAAVTATVVAGALASPAAVRTDDRGAARVVLAAAPYRTGLALGEAASRADDEDGAPAYLLVVPGPGGWVAAWREGARVVEQRPPVPTEAELAVTVTELWSRRGRHRAAVDRRDDRGVLAVAGRPQLAELLPPLRALTAPRRERRGPDGRPQEGPALSIVVTDLAEVPPGEAPPTRGAP